MTGKRSSRGYRPSVERVEGRELAAGGLTGHAVAAERAGLGRLETRVARYPNFPYPGLPGVGPGLGHGLTRLSLPLSYGDYGVITLWNNTRTAVQFTVSASTYQNNTPYLFALYPGALRSFYAPVANDAMPAFTVGFGSGGVTTVLPMDNLVFEGSGYVPASTAGWPYAINFGFNGYSISAV